MPTATSSSICQMGRTEVRSTKANLSQKLPNLRRSSGEARVKQRVPYGQNPPLKLPHKQTSTQLQAHKDPNQVDRVPPSQALYEHPQEKTSKNCCKPSQACSGQCRKYRGSFKHTRQESRSNYLLLSRTLIDGRSRLWPSLASPLNFSSS